MWHKVLQRTHCKLGEKNVAHSARWRLRTIVAPPVLINTFVAECLAGAVENCSLVHSLHVSWDKIIFYIENIELLFARSLLMLLLLSHSFSFHLSPSELKQFLWFRCCQSAYFIETRITGREESWERKKKKEERKERMQVNWNIDRRILRVKKDEKERQKEK